MNNYQWLPTVIDKYVAAYQQRNLTLTAEDRARATIGIQAQTHDSIDALLAGEFEPRQNIPANAPKAVKTGARRIETGVYNYVFFRNLHVDNPRMTYEDALVVYFLHKGIEGIPKYPSIYRESGPKKRIMVYDLGKTLVNKLEKMLVITGILKE